jgi:hypothetical protein
MNGVFENSLFNRQLNFDTSNVTNMNKMFYESQYNHQLNFNTSNVTNIEKILKLYFIIIVIINLFIYLIIRKI